METSQKNSMMEQLQLFVQYKQAANTDDQEMQQDDDTQEELSLQEIEKIPSTLLH